VTAILTGKAKENAQKGKQKPKTAEHHGVSFCRFFCYRGK